MKKLLIYSLLLLVFAGCKKDGVDPNAYPCQDGCYWQPPHFAFIIADSQGNTLLTSTNDEVRVAYTENGQLQTTSIVWQPFKTISTSGTPASTTYLIGDGWMANKSEVNGIKTFYLTFKGKTDTLGLDIHAVTPITADNAGHSTPIISFNGRPMQSVSGGNGDTPDYFVLKRR